ncbi:MAG: hypothetical protein MI921_05400 [Cytophagales bacterium]|nr:hypothetical protein [Cytophagales bacterium]
MNDKINYKFPAALMMFCLLFVQCVVDNEKIIDKDKPSYKTTDPSELFFKNVRALYYDREEMTESKLEVYRIKTRSRDTDVPQLNLAIVLNWRFDEAYILLEPGNQLADIKNITLVWEGEGFEGSEEFSVGNKDTQFTITAVIYEHILKEHKLYWLNQGQKIPLLRSKQDREAFRITMFDFYQLVEIL